MQDGDGWLGARGFNVALFGAAWIVLFAAEHVLPLRRRRSPLIQRLLVNLCVSGLALGTAYAVVLPATVYALREVSMQGVGLLQWVRLPDTATIAIGIALMDLSFYYWHMANHKLQWLWRFHNVHHIDPDLDVSSAFRFHFGEVALSSLFRVVQIVTIGVSPLVFALYEMVFELNTLFQHSNIRLPLAFERALNLLLVTPRMHGIHHSDVQREDWSNFSVVFSIWDRLHRTIRLNIEQSRISIGIPAYFDPRNNTVISTIVLPFSRQRDYWRTSDGRPVRRADEDASAPVTQMQR